MKKLGKWEIGWEPLRWYGWKQECAASLFITAVVFAVWGYITGWTWVLK